MKMQVATNASEKERRESDWDEYRKDWRSDPHDYMAFCAGWDAGQNFRTQSPGGDTMTAYRFKGRATGSDPTGYYYPRWDRAQMVEVIASTKSEATSKALKMLGDHPRFGSRTHYGWAVKWDTISEEPNHPDGES